MARPWCTLLLIIACILYGYEARSNICLKEGTKTYKPLQLYPSDCPANLTNCMAHVYQYDAIAFKSKSVSTLLPKNRESFVYIAQDEEDRLDVVVITKTDYKNNTIQTSLKVTGSAPADILLKDDPGDQWSWDVQNTQGDFTWYLEPTFTDGVVAGHFKIIDDDFCVAVTYLPNWAGAIRNFIALSGTVAKPVRSITKALSLTPGASSTFEFCTYPRLRVTTTSGSCGSSSATAVSLDLPASATYVWKKDGVTVGNTASISGLSAGTYTVTTTVTGGCQATREIVIGSGANSISFSASSNPASFNQPGRIDITVSGGTPPYSIVFRNSAGTIVATNVTTYSGPAGTYTIRIRDGCNDDTHTVEIGAPDACPPGTKGSGGNCENCPAGTFSSSYDSAACTVCPPGQRNNAAGSTSCPSCPANTVTAGGNDPCIDCPKNTYSATGSATCTPCPLGTTRDDGQSECSACGSGSYRCSASGSCTACPAGSFSSAESTAACEKCPAGTYQSATGRSLCVTCPSGQYAPSGSASCQSCPSGKTSPAGSSVLLACV